MPNRYFHLKKIILFTFSFKLFFLKFISKILFWLVINFGQCPIKTKENVSIFEQYLIDFYCHWTTTAKGSHEPYLSPIRVGARGLGLLRNLIPRQLWRGRVGKFVILPWWDCSRFTGSQHFKELILFNLEMMSEHRACK